MLRNHWLSLFCFALLLSSSLYTCARAKVSTAERGIPLLKVNGITVYESLGGPGAVARQKMTELGVGRVTLINGRYIYTKDGLWVDSTALVNRLRQRLPQAHKGRLIVLNWEGKRMMQIVRGAVNRTPEYEEATGQLLRAYRITKSLYPQAIVGFYGFPARNYWKRDESWKQQNAALADFLQEVDAIFPSIYDFYATTANNRKNELGYVQDNVRESLQLGKLLEKPVYPFVCHRYHDSNKEIGLELIAPQEFAEHVKTAARTQVQGEKIGGIVWWSSERYFYNIARKRDGKVHAFDQDIAPITSQYLKILVNALKDE